MYEKLLEARADKLFYYSSVNYIRKIKKEAQQKFIFDRIQSLVSATNGNTFHLNIPVNGYDHVFIFEYLPWDTDFFKMRTHKLHTVLYDHSDFNALKQSIGEFYHKLIHEFTNEFLFIEIPCEDNFLIQAINANSFRLVETRVTYFFEVKNFVPEKRYPTRDANIADIPNIRKTSAEIINVYDRFHSDIAFGPQIAYDFLAKYAEECVKGYSDWTLVPDIPGEEPDAFESLSFLKKENEAYGLKVIKGLLVAASPVTRKGWGYKLFSEAMCKAKELGIDYYMSQTQNANREVIRIWEWVGLSYGCTSHIFSIKKNG
jgi:dTDP-4-amino-4,6-dideoxy-D-galactose acyltransferase